MLLLLLLLLLLMMMMTWFNSKRLRDNVRHFVSATQGDR